MVREWKVFPYGRNIAVVVSAVMDKDRQGAAQKRQAVVRLHEARPKRQRGAAKAAAPGGGKPPLAAKSAVPASSKASEPAAGAGGSRPAKALPASSRVLEVAKAARGLPSPGKAVADFATDISVDDYLGGKPPLVFFLIR
jgi:soluble lytic murein transglycosylase-like protein